jgi:hypothetical protein
LCVFFATIRLNLGKGRSNPLDKSRFGCSFASRYGGLIMFKQAAIALVAIGALTSPAWAGATVVVVKPPVFVSHGKGFNEMTASAANTSRGDRVMAGPEGRAKIVYPDGCTVQVGPGGVASVGVCKQPMTAGLECDPATDPKCLVPPPVVTPWWLIGGAAAGIAVGICAAQCCFENCEPPRSP